MIDYLKARTEKMYKLHNNNDRFTQNAMHDLY